MEEIGKVYEISRMAVSKRLKKLHEKLRSSVS
jgi:DNA-directed RNA polymerase specialized sigma subunit